jgi:ATP-dependent Clp protease ATP-binding subunit ClpA
MFERYTEKARRAIFFACYEASNYGSPYVETEHLLLGILREDRRLATWFPEESNIQANIRSEIEKRITPGERISNSVEVPLSSECKKVLNLAAETSERLAHHEVEPEHILIGILRFETSLAAQILFASGLKADPILARLANTPGNQNAEAASVLLILESFLSGLKSLNSEELISFFAKNAQFIDVFGKQWNRDEISKRFDTLFAPYAKKNATSVIERTLADSHGLFIATVRWNNALLASEQRAWMHRASIVLVPGGDSWEILLVQVTAVDFSSFRQARTG